MIIFLVLGIFIPLAVEAKKPEILITAPNIIHLGEEETISVQMHGATEAVDVHLHFRHEKKEQLSAKKTVNLNSNNQYQALVTLTVDPESYNRVEAKGKWEYVQLSAESKMFTGNINNVKIANIYLSTKKGYIFIQTDKPIYNPGEHANYRIFTLDQYMQPIDHLIQVQIFNCKGLLVYQHILRSEQIIQKNIPIPDVELAGHWKITASFLNFPNSETSVEFEVREYVLPLFEVNIEAPKPYHTLNNDVFPFSISARYTYGKGVDGIAYARFGLVDSKGERTYLPGIEKQTAVQNGHADIVVLTEELMSAAANQSKMNIEGLYLYIAVTVLEKASGDLEEAECTSVKIVTSPYVVDLSKTKRYFTPGGMFSILGTTTFPDGSTVPHLKKTTATVTVNPGSPGEEILNQEHLGSNMGDIIFTFPVPQQARTMSIMVSVEGGDGEVFVSSADITATAIKPEGGSYLSVEVQHQVLQPGQNLQVTFRDITPPGARPSHIYYMVLSKGRIVLVDKVRRTDLTSTSLPFSADMVPSFRLLAYYYKEQGATSIVADSVWVDVRDVCKGKIEILPFSDMKPAQQFNVLVKTDSESKVALSAVDSAVYILNKKNKLSPQKMFDYMNSYDLACSLGGGEDSMSVLQGVGLTYICSNLLESPKPNEHKCNKEPRRLKRDVEFNKLMNSFKHADRKCCEDGRKLDQFLKPCDERLKKTKHQSYSCRQAFKQCCEAATARRKKDKLKKMRTGLGRAFGSFEEDFIDEAAIHLRSYFPQSWMWDVKKTDASGNIRFSTVTPDSITTWEVQAVGISPTTGFCIADPMRLRVFQDFFISVKLPYSVKRNEQLEVKAVVYNYKQETLEVKVKMNKADGLCSAGEGEVVQDVSVPGQSAVAVYFTVVPLIVGKIPISVLAYASPDAQDRIQKELRVEGEGELVSFQKEYNIDSKSEKMVINIPDAEDEVPGQDTTTLLSFKGGVMGESAENCLNLEGVDNLINLPTGCAEQTMVKMSPAIHAMKYLDTNHQWLFLKAERRDEAQSMIQAGYNRVLSYKKEDGSYGAFLKTPSSNWLTAFIAKELTESRDIIQVRDSYIQEAMTYLISKQKANGAWDDPNPLYDKGMKGGVGQIEDEAPLTAFILISMLNAQQVYEMGTGTELFMAINKAKSYLVNNLERLQNPYAVTITAYALSLIEPNAQEAQNAQRKMMAMATCDNKRCFWNVRGTVEGLNSRADAISIEATAYGLLQAVTRQETSTALRIATWLTEQRKFGGGFQSTQDTVVALEALYKFSILNDDVNDLDLKVEVCVNDKQERLHLTKYNALTKAAIQVKQASKVSLNMKGRGTGTVSILHTYRSLRMDESHCDHFHLSVQVEGELVLKTREEEVDQLDDYYNYDTEDDLIRREEPMSREDWFDLRTRRKRQAPEQPKKENRLVYTVCLGLKNENSSGMVVVDISLLSGLTPIIQDLEDNTKGTEKYIDHYDVNHNKVFLYFHKLTQEEDCLRFRVEQIVPIGLVQPAAAVIYDYYSPDRRCSTFYTAPKRSPMLSKLCEADVCTCAEGGCPRLKVTFSKNMNPDTRNTFACFSPVVDYVYTARILNSSSDGVFVTYPTLITSVLQTGKDTKIQKDVYREMVQRLSCNELDIKSGAEYLIMGQDNTLLASKDKFKYILNDNTWIEEVPPQSKCKASRNRQACKLLKDFLDQYFVNQCSH